MYSSTDIFSHSSHVAKLGGNQGCPRCHSPRHEVKSRQTAASCAKCHARMLVPGAAIAPPESGSRGYATSYKDAMHGLCIECHSKRAKQSPQKYGADFASCARCHRGDEAQKLRRMGPYASQESSP